MKIDFVYFYYSVNFTVVTVLASQEYCELIVVKQMCVCVCMI